MSGHLGFYPTRLCFVMQDLTGGKKKRKEKKKLSSHTVSYLRCKQLSIIKDSHSVIRGVVIWAVIVIEQQNRTENRAYDPDVQEKYLQSLFTIMFSRIQHFLTARFCLVKLHISKDFNSFGGIADEETYTHITKVLMTTCYQTYDPNKLYIRFRCRSNTFFFFVVHGLPIMHSLKLSTLLTIFLFYFQHRGDWLKAGLHAWGGNKGSYCLSLCEEGGQRSKSHFLL